jgi:hypothetical protein
LEAVEVKKEKKELSGGFGGGGFMNAFKKAKPPT